MDENRYLEIIYTPTSLFSLKSSEATNSASKSLFIPSPYSIKMALLNSSLTTERDLNFELIRDLKLHIGLNGNLIVNNSFVKIQKDSRNKEKENFTSTVAFREYLFLNGDLYIAIELNSEVVKFKDKLLKLFAQINYFGKRGSFFQFQTFNEVVELKDFYMKSMPSRGVIMPLDDVNKKVKFDNMSSYHSEKAIRVNNYYVLPFKFGRSNRNYSEYTLCT